AGDRLIGDRIIDGDLGGVGSSRIGIDQASGAACGQGERDGKDHDRESKRPRHYSGDDPGSNRATESRRAARWAPIPSPCTTTTPITTTAKSTTNRSRCCSTT